MQNRTTAALHRYIEQTYGLGMWRRLRMAVTAVPAAVRTLMSRRFARGLVALPLAVVTAVLAIVLTGLMAINLGYPLRPVLGLSDHEGGVWSSTYHDAWGGPTLLGAWAVHALLAMLLIFPVLGWAVRGLVQLQLRLTATTTGPARTVIAPVTSRETEQAPARRRIGITGTALVATYLLALLAHAAGIGDNVVWLPRDLPGGLALTVVLSPVIAAAVIIFAGSRPTRKPSEPR